MRDGMLRMITSTSNDKIKNVIKYTKTAKERKKADVFIVEGIRMFVEIPKDMLVETYVTESFEKRHGTALQNITYELVSDHVMEAMTDTKSPQGVLSVVKRFHYTKEQVCGLADLNSDNGVYDINGNKNRTIQGACAQSPLIIALENIQDPGNLGTIVRTAEGAGVTGILMSRDTVDIYNPKVIRSTMGSVFRMPFCYVENFVDSLKELNQKGFLTYSAHLQGTSFYDERYTKPTVFVIGNEGNGLTTETVQATNRKIKIPMQGKVESLNAATAATVLMYEAMRQRSSCTRQN